MPVDFARAAFASTEYRKTSERQDLSVQTREPLATKLEFGTLLASESDAVAFADFILAMYKVPGRNDWTLNVRAGAINPAIGDTITVKYPRFGFDEGKNFIVKRFLRSQASLFDEFTLFGPQ